MRRPLWAGELCDVSESRWVRDAHGPKRREHTPFPTLVFMRRGSYTRRLGGRTYVGDPLQTVYYHAGDDGKVDHPYGDWTVGTGIRLLPGGSLASVLEAMSLGSTHIERGSFPERLAERSVRTERLHRAVVRELRLPERDDVRVEERLVACAS